MEHGVQDVYGNQNLGWEGGQRRLDRERMLVQQGLGHPGRLSWSEYPEVA